jgi:hypothetical protein
MGWIDGSNKSGQAHRVSFELESGMPIPDGLFVLHRCDNRRCVNPRHLFLGTQKNNIDDMISKGRQNKNFTNRLRGEMITIGKLTADHVIEIRRLYATSMIGQVELAKRYGVRQSTISSIIRRIIWRHVP